MQGFKKVLVALLVVATILGTIGPVFAAPKDVAGTKYEDAAVRLMALGVFKGDDKGNFNPDQPITRAEATAIVIRALGLEKSADLMKGVTKFADVNADAGLQWASGAINVAVANGIINGYPDGKFGGRDNVTYAQLAKMVLYALNYGVTVEGGIWPTAVLAKADDLGMLDDLSVVANAPITRGDAAKMLDNSLDVKSLKQTGYGDLKQYEETGATMLEKMNLDEIEGRVVEIPTVEKQLDDDEVTIEVTKVNGEEQDAKDETYTQIEGVDVQGLFGLEVKAWVNDDDEVVFVEPKTSADDVLYDTVTDVNLASGNDVLDNVELKVLDDTVDFAAADKVTGYVNFTKDDTADNSTNPNLDEGMYGRFVLKNNEVVFYSVFEFEKSGVVTAVEDNVVKYFDQDGADRKVNLDDYDAVNVFKANFTKGSVSDIAKDKVVYLWVNSDDDELNIMVADSTVVEGKLEKARTDKVTIDGKDYKLAKDFAPATDKVIATASDNSDDDISAYLASSGELSDAAANLAGAEVQAILDLNGDVRHVRGDSEGTSGSNYGIMTDAYRSGADYVVKIFTKDGEEVAYPVEKRADWEPFGYYFENTFDENIPADLTQAKPYLPVEYEINSDGEVAEGTLKIAGDLVSGNVKFGSFSLTSGDLGFGASGTIPAGLVASDVTRNAEVDAFNEDDDFIKTAGDGNFYVDSDTVIMNLAVDGTKWDDPELLKWEDVKDADDPADNTVYVTVVGEPGADFVTFVKGYDNVADEVEYGVVTADPYYDGDDWWAEVTTADGKNEHKVANKDVVKKGDLIKFTVNASNNLTLKDGYRVDGSDVYDWATTWTESGTVATVAYQVYDDGSYLELNTGDTFKIASDAVVYSVDDEGDLDKALDYNDIYGNTTDGDWILFFKDTDDIIRAVLVVTEVK